MTEQASYIPSFKSNLFDTDGRMILECVYDGETFYSELRRLEGLSKTIENNGEQYTNNVLYDEASYPARRQGCVIRDLRTERHKVI